MASPLMFDLAAHQRERIRTLEQENAGLSALRDHLIRVLAETIAALDARAQVAAMSQDEFMRELQLESDKFTSRPVGHLELVAKPLEKSHGPSSLPATIAVRLGNRELREA
jgi:hypothetical protein